MTDAVQQEIDALYEKLEELDRQAFKNYVATQEIVHQIRELGREVPANKMKEEMK